MNRILSVSITQLSARVLYVEAGQPWYSNVLMSSIISGLIVGSSAGLAVAAVSLVPVWSPVSLAATPTFCITSLLCATVVAVKSWAR